ncbi:MAG: hypothetical protein ACLUEK_10825 [Oscillospiraceae bacterium]
MPEARDAPPDVAATDAPLTSRALRPWRGECFGTLSGRDPPAPGRWARAGEAACAGLSARCAKYDAAPDERAQITRAVLGSPRSTAERRRRAMTSAA